MVFFTCNHCGESVKKGSVEKHYQMKCRGAGVNVSCMDCLKDFRGEEFVAHTKCITEAEKYSGKNYVAKEFSNSGAKKQESWMGIVHSILDSSDYQLSGEERNAFQRLQTVDNVPRKRAKFENFTKNCLRMPQRLTANVWTVLEKELAKMKQMSQQEAALKKAAVKRPAEEELEPSSASKKKATINGNTNGHAAEETPEVAATEESFEWSVVIEKVVGKHNTGLPVERLKKKLLKKYTKKLGLTEELNEKQQKKFEKRFSKNLKKCPGVQVEADVVTLS